MLKDSKGKFMSHSTVVKVSKDFGDYSMKIGDMTYKQFISFSKQEGGSFIIKVK